jgi:spore maturation protein A
MIMSWVWTGMLAVSIVAALILGNGSALSAAVATGAQAGITLILSIGGSICLWSGVGKLMEKSGATSLLSRLFRPVLSRIFPSIKKDSFLENHVSGNVCANLLGLGNAATPMGILAAKRLAVGKKGVASDELCRLIVLNTASIQLIPANVAAVRASLGAASPFDILPAVWITSLSSAALGLCAAWIIGRVAKRD